ncbi:hypothetical protein [Moorena producens]|uniref:hypothetical protein n=1 Tax=Moorena producens TaxID=1155739 RepID=UPI001314F89A|nr:hypothetical protein [Moorena producens]
MIDIIAACLHYTNSSIAVDHLFIYSIFYSNNIESILPTTIPTPYSLLPTPYSL